MANRYRSRSRNRRKHSGHALPGIESMRPAPDKARWSSPPPQSNVIVRYKAGTLAERILAPAEYQLQCALRALKAVLTARCPRSATNPPAHYDHSSSDGFGCCSGVAAGNNSGHRDDARVRSLP